MVGQGAAQRSMLLQQTLLLQKPPLQSNIFAIWVMFLYFFKADHFYGE